MSKPEVWQRGPVPEIPSLLQPVAHALLQAQEELHEAMEGFRNELLWERPANVASVGFHLQHLSGVLDRVFTYARNEPLSERQFTQLSAEDISPNPDMNVADLIKRFDNEIEKCLAQLKTTDINTLTNFRGVGRNQLPSTVLGLLFHAAEHTMRHLGQLRVTAKVVILDHSNKLN